MDFSDLVSQRNDSGQQPNEDVRVDASFVGFVYDYHAVSLKQKILQSKTNKAEQILTLVYNFMYCDAKPMGLYAALMQN